MRETADRSETAMTSIQLENVSKIYPDGLAAVHQLDMTIDDGELRVLLGPSGCGKSTVLRMIAGLESPTSGSIQFDGRCMNDIGPRDRDIAMAFQEHALYPQMTVAENLGFPLMVGGMHATEVARRVETVARLLHIDDALERKPSRLSGGQQQRVSLGRSVIRDPRLFLMDEPLSNLDAKLRLETRTEILRLQRRLGTTTVFVTHDQAEAMAIADRISLMRDGVVAQTGTPTELYEHPRDLFVAQFLGSPQMNVLAGTIVDSGDRLSVRVGSQTIPLTGHAIEPAVATQGRDVAIGFRPEALRREHDGDLVTSVESTEALGHEQLVHASVDAPSVSVTSNGIEVVHSHASPITAVAGSHESFNLWEPFALRIETGAIHLFDLESGRALAA